MILRTPDSRPSKVAFWHWHINQVITEEREKELAELIDDHLDQFVQMTRPRHQGNELSVNDLIFLIENCMNSDIKCSAYMRLIKDGKLEDIKRLSEYMDFSAVHKDGESAVETACMYGRTDVLHYFVDELKLPLERLYDATSLDAVAFAGQYQQWSTITELMKPVSEGGFGYKLPSYIILNYPEGSAVITAQTNKFINEPIESFTIFDTKTGDKQVYTPTDPRTFLGSGSYGIVWVYKFNEKQLAVKIPLGGWITDPRTFCYDDWDNALNEFHCMCQVYPDEGPYALIKVICNDNDIQHFSYRLIMPLIQGKPLDDMLDRHPEPLKQAKMILAVARELHALHLRHIEHGDVRGPNVLVRKDGQGHYKAHFIDFGFTELHSESADLTGENYDFALMLRGELFRILHPDKFSFDIVTNKLSPETKKLLTAFLASDESCENEKAPLFESFPVIKFFVHYGVNRETTPALENFIEVLADKIAEYEWEQAAYSINKIGNEWEESALPVHKKTGLVSRFIGFFRHKEKNPETEAEAPPLIYESRCAKLINHA
jgi:hypothetical protein